jgi:hypothetical protein
MMNLITKPPTDSGWWFFNAEETETKQIQTPAFYRRYSNGAAAIDGFGVAGTGEG